MSGDDDLVQLGAPETPSPFKTKKTETKKKKSEWILGVQVARKRLGITGFQAVKQGTEFHKLATKLKNEMKEDPSLIAKLESEIS
jgi:hypothetical protein